MKIRLLIEILPRILKRKSEYGIFLMQNFPFPDCNYSVIFFSLPERQYFHNRRSATCGCEPKRPLPERQDFNPLPLLF
ncbi:MAG: hypothetical protein LBK82_15035, partial [Planctomycetaceae bacterium]|nr:hypothetical protein [Planctomycetaceae bacterium]